MPASIRTFEVVPNQVFVGLPWKTVKGKYEKAIDKLKISYPLSYVIIGRSEVTSPPMLCQWQSSVFHLQALAS
jgi:hypothetical protein